MQLITPHTTQRCNPTRLMISPWTTEYPVHYSEVLPKIIIISPKRIMICPTLLIDILPYYVLNITQITRRYPFTLLNIPTLLRNSAANSCTANCWHVFCKSLQFYCWIKCLLRVGNWIVRKFLADKILS